MISCWVGIRGGQRGGALDGVHAFTATPGGYYSSGRLGVLVHNGVARFDDLAAWRLP